MDQNDSKKLRKCTKTFFGNHTRPNDMAPSNTIVFKYQSRVGA